jgi:hypothetical protein
MAAIVAEHPVAQAHAPGPIRAYAGWAAWQDTTADGRRYVIRVRAPDGTVTTRPERADVEDPIDPRADGLPFDVGPDREGRPSIAISLCDRVGSRCRVRIGRLPGVRSRGIAGTAQRGVPPGSPTLWGDGVAWVDHADRLWVRRADRNRPQRVRATATTDADLRGDRLAYVTKPSRISRLYTLGVRTGRREQLARVEAGESAQSILAPQFADGGTLMWLTACLGDRSGCARGGFGLVARDLQHHVTRVFADRHGHHGWAPLAADEVLVGPPECLPDETPPWECVVKRRLLGP